MDDWDAQYLTRYNANLHCALATRYHRLELAASIISALAASAALTASLSSASSLSTVWQGVLVVAAISAALRPVMRWGDLHVRHASLAKSYQQLEWRILSMSSEQSADELRRLEAQESTAEPWRWKKLCDQATKRTRRELKVE